MKKTALVAALALLAAALPRTAAAGGCSLTIATTNGVGSQLQFLVVGGLTSCKAADHDAFLACFREKLEDDCDCIDSLLVVGHGNSGLGGDEGVAKLTLKERKELRGAMCADAKVEIRKCESLKQTIDVDVARVLVGGKDGVNKNSWGFTGKVLPHGIIVSGKKLRYWIPSGVGTSDNFANPVKTYNDKVDQCWEDVHAIENDDERGRQYQKCLVKTDKWWADWMKERGDSYKALEEQDLKAAK